MLKLSLPKQPYWIDVGLDVRLKVRPCASAVFYQARAFMNKVLSDIGEEYRKRKESGADIEGFPDVENPETREALAEQYLTIGLARAGIVEWEGVLEADSDKPAPATEQKIDELFRAYWMIAESFRQQYTGMRELLEAEKNARGLVSDGTSETGRDIAASAPSKAAPAPGGKKAKRANDAPTSSTA